MSNVGFATLAIVPSVAAFGPTLNKQSGEFGAVGRAGGARLGAILLTVARFALPAIAVVAAIDLGVRFIGGAVSEASDLGESVNALNVVYGEHSACIQKLGQSAAQALGLSNVEFNGLAVQFSNFAKTVAGPGGDVVGVLQDLTGRASDFASVMNLDVAEAASLFQSGLAGETEPLRRFGIDLSAAAVEAYAYANGIAAANTPLTEAQKVQARYGLLMQSTAQTAGDFANTQDSLANVQRRLSSSWADLTAKIGAAFLPILEKLLGFVNSTVLPGLETVGGAVVAFFSSFGRGDGAISALIPQLLGLAAAFSPLSLVLQSLQPSLPIIGAMLAELAAQLGPLASLLLGLLSDGARQLASNLQSLAETLSAALIATLSMAVEHFASLAPILASLAEAVLPLAASVLAALLPIFADLSTSVLPAVAELLGVAVAAIAPLVSMIVGLLIPIIEALMPVVEVVFDVIADVIQSALTVIMGVIDVVTGLISGNWEQVWTGIMSIFSGIWDLIVSIVTGAAELVGTIVIQAITILAGLWDSIWTGIASFLSGLWEGIVSTVSDRIADVVGFFQGLPGTILGALAGFGSLLVDTGRNLIQGLLDGFTAMSEAIATALLAPISGTVGDLVDHLEIRSPSRLLSDLGEDVGDSYLDRTAARVYETPEVPEGGVAGVILRAREHASSKPKRLVYEDRGVSLESKEAKLLRAEAMLRQHRHAHHDKPQTV